MYTTSLKAKICFAMKCAIANNYLQRNTDKMPDLHAMIFPGSKIAGKRVFQIALSGWGKSVKEGGGVSGGGRNFDHENLVEN